MEQLKTSAGDLKEHVKDYIDTYKKLTVVKATKGASAAASGAVVGILAFLFILFFLILLNVGLGIWLGGLINSMAGGFFIVAGFYLLLTVILFATRNKLIVPMMRKLIISKVYG
ncbi:MAG: phage holin family protein [Chitinophagaceae bacterium]|nr:phage holin family protein [Chitinophagaceae bacterium]